MLKKDTDLQIFVIELSPMGMCRIKICLPLSTASFPLFSLALHGISGSPRYSKKKLKIEKAVYTYMYMHALEMSGTQYDKPDLNESQKSRPKIPTASKVIPLGSRITIV